MGLLLLPLVLDPYWQRVLCSAGIYALLAIGFDFLAEYVGLVCLGGAFFIGAGGYIAGLLNEYFHWSPLFTIPSRDRAGRMHQHACSCSLSQAPGYLLCHCELHVPSLCRFHHHRPQRLRRHRRDHRSGHLSQCLGRAVSHPRGCDCLSVRLAETRQRGHGHYPARDHGQ